MSTPTSWAEVADTAVKIGLSGIIAAISGYYIATRTQRHDLNKEYFKRRQDVIERVSASFELIHALFFEIALDYSTLVGVLNEGLPASQDTRDKYFIYIKDIGKALREMHVLEGKLLVVGASEATQLLRSYRLQATEINSMIKLSLPTKTKEEVEAIMNELFQRREQFYKALSQTFQSI